MAVDTALKRASVLNYLAYGPVLLPVPSGTIGVGPRQMAVSLYATGSAGAPPTRTAEAIFGIDDGVNYDDVFGERGIMDRVDY